jgi:hypothetical protein
MSELKKYKVTGKIEITVEIEVEATNSTQAETIAEETLDDAYNLNIHGYYHRVEKDVDYSLNAREI